MGSRGETKAQSVTNMSTLVEPGKTRDPKPLAGEGQAVWLPPPDGQASQKERRDTFVRLSLELLALQSWA